MSERPNRLYGIIHSLTHSPVLLKLSQPKLWKEATNSKMRQILVFTTRAVNTIQSISPPADATTTIAFVPAPDPNLFHGLAWPGIVTVGLPIPIHNLDAF